MIRPILLCALIVTLAGCCGTRETQIVERTVTAPPIHIRDTVYVPQKIFVYNSQCDTAAILEKYCIGEAEHTDSAGNYWKARYTWKDGMFTEYVRTHPQTIRYIDTTIAVSYTKIDPPWYWRLWFGFKVCVGFLGVLVIAIGILYGLSKFNLIKLPFGL